MTFLNFALLAGAAALAVPLLIHLLSRRRYTPVRWGAMFLIEQVVRQNRRRVRLEQFLLLLIRCAIPVALAFAMARPVMTGWRALVGDEPTSSVIVLDASYSMSAPTSDGGTGAGAAEDALASVVEGLPMNSQATVLVAGSGTRIIEGFERRSEAERKDIAVAELGPVDAPAAIAAAEGILKDARHRRREIVFLSDFQKLNFTAPAAPAALDDSGDGVAELLPDLTFVCIDTSGGPNLVIEEVTLAPATAGANRPVRVRALVRNAGATDLRSVPVRLIIDGKLRDEAHLSVSAGATTEANFIARFDSTGFHTMEVVLESDALPADNVFRVAVNVPEALPVLLVSGQTDLPFPQNPADFLALALDPSTASAQAELSGLLRPQVITPDQISGRALAEARVVLLADVPSLSEQQVGLLREFVRGGGGLFVVPGEQIDVAFYSSLDLFPARIASLRGGASTTRIIEPPYAHPALVPWNDPGNGRLGESTIKRWYSLVPRSGASVIAAFESGEPFLVEQPLGRGTVIMLATSASSDWSDLPLRAGFLPLVQQLVTYGSARSSPPLNVWSGEPLETPLAPELAENLVMISPDSPGREQRAPGSERSAEAGSAQESRTNAPFAPRHAISATIDRGRTVARFTETARPGFYRLVRAGAEDAPLAIFAVNAPRAESDLAKLSSEELLALAEEHGAAVVEGAAAYAALDRDRRYGREVWRGVWIAVLALLFAELLLQAWFARGSPMAHRRPGEERPTSGTGRSRRLRTHTDESVLFAGGPA